MFSHSSVVLPNTIFASLMLNTMSQAHNKIFGAKFLSFEHLKTIHSYTVCYAVFGRLVVLVVKEVDKAYDNLGIEIVPTWYIFLMKRMGMSS